MKGAKNMNHTMQHYSFVHLVGSIVCLVPGFKKNAFAKKEKIPVESIIRMNLNKKLVRFF